MYGRMYGQHSVSTWFCDTPDAFECLTFGQSQYEEQSLESTVFNLLNYVRTLEEQLKRYEKRLQYLEECDCFKSCRVNGSLFADGSHWKEGCNIAYCEGGQVKRKPVQCPKLPCRNPVKEDGLCCPVCKKQCLLNGRVLEHNQRIKRHCLTCTCNDGSVRCQHEDPNSCPPLHCPIEKQFSKADECCRFCEGEDFCARGHNCDMNAKCKNLKTEVMCECNKGFWGDGTHGQCTDIDECRKKSGSDAHNCQANSKCINTPGSFRCECLPGFIHLNSTLCIDMDECETGQHDCREDEICINTPGSYDCQIKPIESKIDGKFSDGQEPGCDDDNPSSCGESTSSSFESESNDEDSESNSVEEKNEDSEGRSGDAGEQRNGGSKDEQQTRVSNDEQQNEGKQSEEKQLHQDDENGENDEDDENGENDEDM